MAPSAEDPEDDEEDVASPKFEPLESVGLIDSPFGTKVPVFPGFARIYELSSGVYHDVVDRAFHCGLPCSDLVRYRFLFVANGRLNWQNVGDKSFNKFPAGDPVLAKFLTLFKVEFSDEADPGDFFYVTFGDVPA